MLSDIIVAHFTDKESEAQRNSWPKVSQLVNGSCGFESRKSNWNLCT